MKPKLWTPDGFHLVEGFGRVVNPDGSVAWEDDDWQPNAVADEGEASIINVYLRELTNPSKYLGLLADAGIVETDTLATMVEAQVPGANGYNRQQIAAGGWGAPGLDSGDMQSEAAEETFGPASGSNWTGITHVFLGTVLTGTAGLFLLFVPLSGTTTINIGQSFKYTLRWKTQ